eukprot:g12683.t2
MELLKNPKNLQRAVSLVQQTQSGRSTKLVKKAQSARDLLATSSGMSSKELKSALKTGFNAFMAGAQDDKRDRSKTPDQPKKGDRGTDALRGAGFTVYSQAGARLAPTTTRNNYTNSRAEMMETLVYKIKEVYFPHTVNVVTWDAALEFDLAKCCGMEECGTAVNGSGLEYRFVVFRGVGEINWTGGVPRGGIPDVACSGNYGLGNGSSIWFGNTDGSPHFVVSDLNQLW